MGKPKPYSQAFSHPWSGRGHNQWAGATRTQQDAIETSLAHCSEGYRCQAIRMFAAFFLLSNLKMLSRLPD